ncbi:diacylglycerol/lipid kinase family protein [Seonamhaeicola aphaedonensis]|uniref:Diacylglycerol kinase family enzyme n=1 Tax=Seonamhaeicola aphaedonensis TaxID=1461338 RepID=A0A3D9HKZ5_9FLAO|nr:diacylglycerol kinase family protein [Seonamhaeicola aphaedonensis]RED50143.1 diacylglycerol kinase family enzyme [Seonamhaeicola aphaedonensis]
MKPKKLVILVNLNARQGKSANKWKEICSSILDIFPEETEIVTYMPPCDFNGMIKSLYHEKKIDGFVSAGGDGSLNYMLNVLLNIEKSDSRQVYIGGIGLGSSNDFHKPFNKYVKNVPVKINWKICQLYDVGKITYEDINEQFHTRYFIINASMGITAEANYRFNHPKFFLKFLKRYWVDAAIFFTAVKTIFLYRNYNAELLIDDKINETITLSNLSVIKNPNISGSFRYEQNISFNDNVLGLNYCDRMNKVELLRTLIALIKGKFSTNSKRKTYKLKSLNVFIGKPMPIEADGEVFIGKNCRFSVVPNAIYIMN